VPSKPRDQSAGYHHIGARGNNKRPIFVDDDDRWFFCLTVNRMIKKHGWTVVAYCLMRNHYHLALEADEGGLAKGMCELNTACARAFNARHGRINHLFGSRYWNEHLTTDASIRNAVRYIVQNPTRAGGKLPLEAYVWSSYAATIGVAFARIKLARDQLLPLFGRTPEEAIERFRVFCNEMPRTAIDRRQPP
jgi:REP element-mobilizing transposase RayT